MKHKLSTRVAGRRHRRCARVHASPPAAATTTSARVAAAVGDGREHAEPQGQGRRDPAGHRVLGSLGDARTARSSARRSRPPASSRTSRTPTATRRSSPRSPTRCSTSGANVLLIVNLDSPSAAAVIKKAKQQGVPVIDYDRLTLGGGATTTCPSTTWPSAPRRARAS